MAPNPFCTVSSQYLQYFMEKVSPLEWAIGAVSAIEGASNYINYIKETKKRKNEKKL